LENFILHLVEQVRITKYTKLFWPKTVPVSRQYGLIGKRDGDNKYKWQNTGNSKECNHYIREKISRLIERADLDSLHFLFFHFFPP